MSVAIRRYERGDMEKGMALCLSFFTDDLEAGTDADETVEQARMHGGETFVAVEGDEVVGTASCFAQRKLIHAGQGALAGYVEDVAVRQDRRRTGVGEALVKRCLSWLAYQGCYKAVLDCDPGLVPFYEKCGLYENGAAMRADLP